MKFKFPKLKLPLPLQITLGILGAVAAIGLGFFIVQRYFSIFSYLGMKPEDVTRVKASIESQCVPISTAVRDGFGGVTKYRGVYMCNGFPMYYHYDVGNDSADYSIYPILWQELWSSKRDWSGLTGTTTVY